MPSTTPERLDVGRTIANGYGREHKRARKLWAARLATAGQLPCPRCGKPVTSAMPWDLGHTDDRSGYTGPEHVACNRRAGARSMLAQRYGVAPSPPPSVERTWR